MTARLTGECAFLAGTAAAAATADAGHRAEQADPHRPADGEDRAAGAGRHPDGAGHQPVPEGPQQHAGRPQGRAAGRRYRRQPRRHQDQGAGTDRARQRRHDLRPAGRVRAARHLRLRGRAQDADPQPGRRRGHVAAQAQSVFRARLRHLGAEHACAGRLRGEGAEVQERHHHQRGLRLRLRADGRLPARVRGRRRPRGEEAVAADRHARLHAVSSRSSAASMRWCRASPAPIR